VFSAENNLQGVYGPNLANNAFLPEATPSRHDVEALAKAVAGLTAFVIDFDGPRTAYIGVDPMTQYVTLCSGGIKASGAASPSFHAQEAVELYAEQLRAMIVENKGKQLAWRCRPKLECDGHPAKCRVYSRLAFL